MVAPTVLGSLERLRATYGAGAADAKLEALRRLERARLRGAAQVLRLHECLCFLRACPDSPAVLAQVERMLAGFARRADLRRHARALENSGIAGTPIRFAFFADTAVWLARRHPGRMRVDWTRFERRDDLERLLHLLALYAETPGLDDYAYSVRDWIGLMKGETETDADFLLRRAARLPVDGFVREALLDLLDVPMVLHPGPGTPSRTLARLPGVPIAWQTAPLDRARPDLRRAVRRPPPAVVACGVEEGRALVDIAREAMVVRSRDLDAFIHADPRDVRRVRWEDGLEFAVLGVRPGRRLLLEAVYAFLTLRNGVPIGYVLVSALFRSSEIAYNVFDTWRGSEAARIYARVLATTRHLFGVDTFTIMPYQLGGQGNTEGLASGAWWFYRKLGFTPRDPAAVRLMRREQGALRRDPGHRSGLATLRVLGEHNLFLALGRPREDVIGRLELGRVGLHVTRFLARGWGADRERAARDCVREAARLLGAGRPAGLPAGERLAFERWAPLVLALPGVTRWSAADRRALAAVVRAKGGRRESEFVRRFDAHARLRAAIRRLAATDAG